MKLSVCIPTYNGAPFIEAAIRSVLNQSFSDFELIIVDDKSTDQTVEIIKKINDSRIKLVLNDKNIGHIPNWNKSIELACGEYIKLLPQDDLIYPGCLQLQYDILEKDIQKRISIVCGRRYIIDHNGKILFSRGYGKKEKEVNGIEAINKVVRFGASNIIGEPGTIMFRKEIINDIGFFNSDIFYTLDLDQYFKMLQRGNLYVLPQIIAAFRVSRISASVSVTTRQRSDCVHFIRKIYSEKKYGVLWSNYIIGIFNAYILTTAKKILYKYVLNGKQKD